MFDRFRQGYGLLVGLALLQFALIFPVANLDLSVYFSLRGLTSALLPAWLLFPMIWALGLAIAVTRRQVDHPLRAMRRMLYANRNWLGRCSVLAVVMITYARVFTSYKTLIPDLMPFWADPLFVSADQALFGIDPWRLTHAVIGPIGTVVLDRIYAVWFAAMMLCLGWFCFARDPKLQLRGLLTSLLSWTLLGILFATAFSSVGPCFYENFFGNRHYVPLMERLNEIDRSHNLIALGAMKFLLGAFGKDQFGAGISAMPSLHVSIATMCFMACYSYAAWRWLKVASAIFALAIFIGSVHLGWHYLLDGIVGAGGVTLIWWATGRYVDWLDARDKARVALASAPPLSSLPATA